MHFKMSLIFLSFFLTINSKAMDLVMTADEVSNTVSFVEASTFKTIAYLPIGPNRRFALNSSVKSQLQNNVHGLAFSPDKKLMVVTSNISNSVAIYDTDNFAKPKYYINVGLSPHVSSFTPDGKEIWVATRGTSEVEIIDSKKGIVTRKLKTQACPSFFAFQEKKSLVYITYTCTSKVEVYNYKTKKLKGSVDLNGTFSPLISLSPDQKELWVIRKDSGEVARISTEKLSVLDYIKVGLYPQHVLFGMRNGKTIGLVTVGGENVLKTYSFDSGTSIPALLTSSIEVPGLPHGLAVSANKETAFVATEHGDMVYSLSLNESKVTASARVGSSPQSLVFVSGLDLKDYKTYLRRFAEQLNPKFFTLKSKSLVDNTISISIRPVPSEINFYFQVYGKLPKEEVFKFYLTTSRKNLEKVEDGDRKLIGIIGCNNKDGFICLSTTSLPYEDNLASMVNDPSLRIYALNKEGHLLFQNEIKEK